MSPIKPIVYTVTVPLPIRAHGVLMRARLSIVVILLTVMAASAQEDTLPSGRIAIIGADGNVHVLDPAQGERVTLTDDATRSAQAARIYEWPTWSTDGRLAYFETYVDRQGAYELTVHVSADGQSVESGTVPIEGHAFTYAAWAPQNCPGHSEPCRDLAVLTSPLQRDGFVLHVLRQSQSETVSLGEVGTGAPFYVTWSPDATRMAWQRNQIMLDVYDVSQMSLAAQLEVDLGEFFAPDWSPVDDRILYGARSEGADRFSDLAITSETQAEVVRSNVDGPISMSWSPDGNLVAFTDGAGTFQVLDPAEHDIVNAPIDGVLAFFWSPDSESVALVTQAFSPGALASRKLPTANAALQPLTPLQWSVVDVDTGDIRAYSSFVPTESMGYLLSFFDQFAQSHPIWSPDSRQIVYSELTPDRGAIITVLDISSTISVPLTIAEGEIGVWSYQ